jgi:hypothetical protein
MKTVHITRRENTEQVKECSSVDHAIRSPGTAVWALLTCMLWVTLPGCAPEGKYVGGIMDPAVENVLLFDIDGPAGNSFVKMLGTGLAKRGLTVKYASDIDPLLNKNGAPDNTLAADFARQAGAQAFIRGETTKSEVTAITQYVVRGHFGLYETKGALHVGGVPDARFTKDTDPFVAFKSAILMPFEIIRRLAVHDNRIYGPPPGPTEADLAGPEVKQKLADHVADQLTIGLGKK